MERVIGTKGYACMLPCPTICEQTCHSRWRIVNYLSHGTLALEPFILEMLAGGRFWKKILCGEKENLRFLPTMGREGEGSWIIFHCRTEGAIFRHISVCSFFFSLATRRLLPFFFLVFPHTTVTHTRMTLSHTRTRSNAALLPTTLSHTILSHTHTMLHTISAHTRSKVECRNL